MKIPALVVVLLALSVPASAEVRVFGRYYPPHYSNLSGVPGKEIPMIGEFGMRYEGERRLRLVGGLDTKIIRNEVQWKTIASAFYHIGARYSVTKDAVVEVMHGSWHLVDRIPGTIGGKKRSYNYVGLEIEL